MKPRRMIHRREPDYPTQVQFREALRSGLAAAGLGALLTLPSPGQPPNRTAGVPPRPKTEETQLPPGDDAQIVAQLTGKLGDADSRVRQDASRALIAMAVQCEQQEGQTVYPRKDLVLAALRRLEQDPDPEIAQRAGEIIRAVEEATTVVPPPDPPVPLLGVIAMPEPDEAPPEANPPPKAE